MSLLQNCMMTRQCTNKYGGKSGNIYKELNWKD